MIRIKMNKMKRYLFILMAAAAMLTACQEKKESTVIIAPKPEPVKPSGPILMQDMKAENSVEWIGKTYKVTEVKAGAFKGLKKLAKLTIGKNVKTIGSKAFYNCKKLKSIVIKTTKLTDKTVGADTFKGIDKKATIQVPSKKLKAYKTLLVQKGAPKTCKIK